MPVFDVTENTDILTLAEAKAALNIRASDANFDTELALWTTAVSAAIDAYCGPVVVRTITDETHYNAGGLIFLRYTPVSAVSTVTEYSSGTAQALAVETVTASTAYDYMVDTATGILTRRSSWTTTTFAPTVTVTYTAGRYANTAAVAPLFKLAAGETLSHLWKIGQGSGTVSGGEFFPEPTGFLLPNRVEMLLAAERRAPAIA